FLGLGLAPLGLGLESLAVLLDRPLAFGECDPEPMGLVQGLLPAGGRMLLLGAGRLEIPSAPIEPPGEPTDFAPGGGQLGGLWPFPLRSRAVAVGLLIARSADLVPEPIDLGGQRSPFPRQSPHFRWRDAAQPGANRPQFRRDSIELLAEFVPLD